MEREDFGLQWLLELHGVMVHMEDGFGGKLKPGAFHLLSFVHMAFAIP